MTCVNNFTLDNSTAITEKQPESPTVLPGLPSIQPLSPEKLPESQLIPLGLPNSTYHVEKLLMK